MKAEFLKIAGVKTEKAFYKKYPTEAAFFKAHPEANKMIKKAQAGTVMAGMTEYLKGMQPLPNMQNVIQGQTQTPGVNSSMVPYEKPDYNKMYMGMSTADEQLKQPSSGPGAGEIVAAGAKTAAGLADMYKGLRAERRAKKEAQMWANVSDVQARASETQDIDAPRQMADQMRKKREAFMPVTTGEEFFPTQGVGTNVLARNGMMVGGNPTEIQNTYAPEYDIYSDLGYEPLNDSEQVKQFIHGGHIRKAQSGIGNLLGSAAMAGMGSIFGGNKSKGAAQTNTATQDSNFNAQLGNIGAGLGSALGGNNATSGLGSTLAEPLAIIPGVGTTLKNIVAGPLNLVGGLLNTNNRDRKKAEARSKQNQNRMLTAQTRDAMQGQFGGYMEDGGNVNPQVISKFGDYDMSALLRPPYDADMLRAGGHVRGGYQQPYESGLSTMEEGGELQTHWGGYMEDMSQNPYLPGDGVTVMPRGQSHEESDGRGNTGIGITYGGNPVEVERGEPMIKLKDGTSGEDNLTVYGNLMIPKYGLDLLKDPKAKGKKFKNYVADLSKTEAKQNKLIEKSTNELNELDVNNSFDKLKLASLEASIKGGNMKLKEIADKKIKAADLQNAINDTAEEYGLVADDLAKGKTTIDKKAMKLREAMFGTKLTKAQDGDKLVKGRGEKWSFRKAGDTGNPVWDDSQRYKEEWTPAVETALSDKERAKRMIDYINSSQGEESQKVKNKLNKFSTEEDKIKFLMTQGTNREVGPIHHVLDAAIKYTSPGMTTQLKEEDKSKVKPDNKFEVVDYKRNPWVDAYNELLPFLRPTDQEALSPNQLMGEMYALSTNQLEPVQAQSYSPQLRVPYDISLQDQLNDITAEQRAAQKMMGYNPAAQANLAAQTYGAKSKVLADQFRANQAMKDQVYSGNIEALNDAELKNLAIYDQQYQRQSQAKSNTKALAQSALSSISDKYAKNALENKTLGTYENLYNYRYDALGRAVNMNPLFQPNVIQKYNPGKNPNYILVDNGNGTFSYKLKTDVTPDDTVVEQPAVMAEELTPINQTANAKTSTSKPSQYDNSYRQTNEEIMQEVAPKRAGGKVRKNYSQSSIVKAFK